MTIHYDGHGVTVYHGDCIEVLRELSDSSVDAVVTDPPYGLEFMGKEWDSFKPAKGKWNHEHAPTLESARDTPHHRAAVKQPSVLMRCQRCGGNSSGQWNRCQCPTPEFRQQSWPMQAFQSWCTEWASECLRVLKPGGHMVVFGGTRTYHRMTCAIEDAGFEIRDCLSWMYGSGFPKSLDVSKAIDKAAGAEREVIERRRTTSGGMESVNRVLAQHGYRPNDYSDGENVLDVTAPATDDAVRWDGWQTALKPAWEPAILARKPLDSTVVQNVLTHGTGALNINATRIAANNRPARVTDPKQTDNTVYAGRVNDSLQGGSRAVGTTDLGRWPANVALDEEAAALLDEQSGHLHGSGNKSDGGVGADTPYEASSYHISYAGRANRDFGAEGGGASRFFYTSKASASERPEVAGVRHVTVKPLDLMEWLVRLVTQPDGVVLDPFAGSGTTAEACVTQGFRCITIEKEADYLPLIVSRVTRQRDPVAHVKLVGDANPTLFDDL